MRTDPRIIVHVDMDAFYAAIEVRDNPQYRGLPVIVGAAPGGRGVVAAASYEARRYGIRSAMPVGEASARCPHAVFLPVDMGRYRAVSAQLFDLLDTFTPQVEPLSIDEAFLDLTGCPPPAGKEEGDPLAFAQAIKIRIGEVLALPVSVGVAPNKFLAKVASELAKPDGLMGIRAEEAESVLGPLPVTVLWGVGEHTHRRLTPLGIRTVEDLRRTPISVLRASLGFAAEHLARLSRGLDDRSVSPSREAKSHGRETTFERDTTDQEVLVRILGGLAEDVGRSLRAGRVRGRTITLKVRYDTFYTVTRSSTLAAPTNSGAIIYREAAVMLSRLAPLARPVRLVGVSVSGLEPSGHAQGSLFGEEQQVRVDQVVDAINERFGEGTVRQARDVDPEDPPAADEPG